MPNATVIFFPEGEGRVSSGVTDDEGTYTLVYDRSESGAVLGKHRVEIRTGGETLDEDGNVVSETVEILPSKYHAQSTLSADVAEEANEIDFPLVSRE